VALLHATLLPCYILPVGLNFAKKTMLTHLIEL
jgi:hypothetical protein